MAKKKSRMRGMSGCMCHSEQPYEACCAPYHLGKAFAPDPTTLMRSRYCAYARGLAEYVIKTTHPLNEDTQEENHVRAREILIFGRDASFDGLIVMDAGLRDGADDWGWVHFFARLNKKGHDASFEEISQFAHDDDGHWAYVGGEIIIAE